ncbi:hypothetical protein LPW11_07635 [Geomonas sp. RF6]|uniref:lysozyme inhibitor LprI family protein n=1 Tax=Geomonas sp. RF6 TaxID=2897342 RepID=UPI001E49B833|nr:lysozyme inhibitor LprI family protein [Geomonas sp. RF6]UFS72053.1 hypothetical protein LPW11_07635 [Geomonas sp. RF6]
MNRAILFPLPAFALCFIMLLSSEVKGETSTPTTLLGTWQVCGVRLDTTLLRTPNYGYDDVRLTGRLVTIASEEITTDMPESSSCQAPKAEKALTTMDELIEESMGRPKGRKVTKESDRFELPVEGGRDLQVWWIRCEKGDIGPDTPFGPEGANWVAALSKDRLAMRWYDNVILLLTRVRDKEPHPSFPCVRAKSAAEKAICSSFSLSSFDESVARAFAAAAARLSAVKGNSTLQAEQKAWISRRDRCGSDEECLKKTMQDRLEQLHSVE